MKCILYSWGLVKVILLVICEVGQEEQQLNTFLKRSNSSDIIDYPIFQFLSGKTQENLLACKCITAVLPLLRVP